VVEYGDVLSEPEGELENAVVFRLDAGMNPAAKEKRSDDPMWASSSTPIDWFFADE
jgi:hypothetical protein